MNIFLQGLVLGLAYVAPIGMQNLFVINSALSKTRTRALATSLIVIFFDVTLALACFFGIGTLMQKYPVVQMAVLLIGGLSVTGIGISLLRSKTQSIGKTGENLTIGRTICSACVVTWFNAQAVIDGTMLLGASTAVMSGVQPLYFLAGVICASCLWFTGLALVVSLAGNFITPRLLWRINKICGAVIVLYGVKLIWHFAELL